MEVRAKDNNGEEVDLLWSARKFATSSRVELGSGMLSVGVLAEAIADTFRVETELDDDCVELLGGKVFKSRTKQPLSNDGWDLLYSLVSSRFLILLLLLGTDKSFSGRLLWMFTSRYIDIYRMDS